MKPTATIMTNAECVQRIADAYARGNNDGYSAAWSEIADMISREAMARTNARYVRAEAKAAEPPDNHAANVAMAAIKAVQPIIEQLPEGERFAAADKAAREIRRALERGA